MTFPLRPHRVLLAVLGLSLLAGAGCSSRGENNSGSSRVLEGMADGHAPLLVPDSPSYIANDLR